MKQIKDKMTFFVVLFSVIVTSVSMLYLVANKNNDEKNNVGKKNVRLYYENISTGLLEFEEKELQSTAKEDIIVETLENLKSSPSKENLVKIIPDAVKFQNVYFDKSNIILDISENFNDLKPGDKLKCMSSIFCTLTNVEFVDKVKVTINGRNVLKTNGKEVGWMSRYNIITDNQILPEPLNYEKVKLYFAKSEMKGLESEERIIEVNPNQPIENYVLQQLLAGPQKSTSLSIIPSDTKISFLRTVDGVCYVDLSRDLLQKLSLGTINETLAIYSIVNSLCTLDSIEKVKFLSDGEKIEDYKGNLDLSNAFIIKTI